jgi:hypothetical protein
LILQPQFTRRKAGAPVRGFQQFFFAGNHYSSWFSLRHMIFALSSFIALNLNGDALWHTGLLARMHRLSVTGNTRRILFVPARHARRVRIYARRFQHAFE